MINKFIYTCVRCSNTWNAFKKEGYKLGWRFHGKLTYCPTHKIYQFSLGDRDEDLAIS